MITIQIPEAHQADAVSRFIENHHLIRSSHVNLEESMILMEGDSILGYAAYHREADEASVVMTFIDPAMRGQGFGDGLLRALLNLMERNGIRRFFIPSDAKTRGFFLSEGLCDSTQVPDWAESPVTEPSWFEGTLPEFFQKPCKGGHH